MDARHRQLVHLRQQVVQTVAAFVEQGNDVVVAEGSRLTGVTDRGREVAVEIGHRRLHAARDTAAGNRLVHPGPAALGFARIQV